MTGAWLSLLVNTSPEKWGCQLCNCFVGGWGLYPLKTSQNWTWTWNCPSSPPIFPYFSALSADLPFLFPNKKGLLQWSRPLRRHRGPRRLPRPVQSGCCLGDGGEVGHPSQPGQDGQVLVLKRWPSGMILPVKKTSLNGGLDGKWWKTT